MVVPSELERGNPARSLRANPAGCPASLIASVVRNHDRRQIGVVKSMSYLPNDSETSTQSPIPILTRGTTRGRVEESMREDR